MARTRRKSTSPEIQLRRALWAAGLRYRVEARTPVCRPDIVFTSMKVAVFLDGCWWHGCPQHYSRPRKRAEHWAQVLAGNLERDRCQTLSLEGLGWRVVRIWQCDLKRDPEAAVALVEEALYSPTWRPAPSWRVARVDLVGPAQAWERRRLETLRTPDTTLSEQRTRATKGRAHGRVAAK